MRGLSLGRCRALSILPDTRGPIRVARTSVRGTGYAAGPGFRAIMLAARNGLTSKREQR